MTNTTKPEALSRNTIVPAEYTYVESFGYVTVDGGHEGPIEESFGMELVEAILESATSHVQGKYQNDAFQCALCGARYKRGDVFCHTPTGAYMFLGWQCADEFADVSEFVRKAAKRKKEAAHKIALGKAAAAKRRAEVDAVVDALVAEFPTLREDLEVDHYITSDIRSRLNKWGKISAKQAALVVKIAAEKRNPKPAEAHCDAPEGRVEFEGVIVSAKTMFNDYDAGQRDVITVKITEDSGDTWLAWFSLPAGLAKWVRDAQDGTRAGWGETLKGSKHKFRVTLKRSDRDAHFAFGKRPHYMGAC